MEKERSNLKKLILILLGISLVLGGVIFVIYKNNESNSEEVVDIFKDNEKDEDKKEDSNDNKDNSKVVVDIKGMVANPGIYEVDSTSRVNDVIALAGGLIEGADTSLINLAKIVEDEMTIIIYSNSEVLEKYKEEICVCKKCDIVNDACINNDDNNGLVNINSAGLEELQKIEGIGESKAKAIIEYREKNGYFQDIEDIKKVTGIGESLFEKIKIYITI